MAEALKEEMDSLRQQMKDMELKHKLESKPAPIYVRSERKVTKLSGRPTKDSDPDVDDWISDMKEHIASIPTNEGKFEFVLDHLTGNAKAEVRLRPPEMKRTAKDVLKIIEDTYKTQDTLAQLRHKFYERNQQENETLEAYSLVLMKLMDKICKKEGDVTNRD